MKRPILIAVIGYIIGIIVGLYFTFSIVLFYIPIIVIYLIYKIYIKGKTKKFKLFSIRRYLRYAKIYINYQTIILIMAASIISNFVIIFQNNMYEKIQNILSEQENIKLVGIVISEKQEKPYYNKYKIQIKYNNRKIKLYITTKKGEILEYGDKIIFSGTFMKPEMQRNYKGFNYSQYLKQLKIYGTIRCEKIKIVNKNQGNKILQISNKISNQIIYNTKKILDEETSSILLGIILGDKTNIDEEKQENFKNASMSHILAVSGMHVTYIILGMNIILKKIIGKRQTHILNILILTVYMFITNFSPSITRAGIMGIIMLFSKIIYRKNDIYTSISISLFSILIYNPFLIQNLGLKLSYGGIIGIVIFNKSILKILKDIKINNKTYKYKIRPKFQNIIDKVKEILSISFSVQLFILPIILYNLNTFSPYFLISNLILSIFIGPIVITGFLFIIVILINIEVAKLFREIIKIGIQILIIISKLGNLPKAKIYVATPNLFLIIIYYFFSIIILFIYNIYTCKKSNKTYIRVKNIIALIKLKLRKHRTKLKKIVLLVTLVFIILKYVPKNLNVYFIDVGQGDSSFIVTPRNKTILIDGGGSRNSDFNGGKNTLVPYILDRGFNKIDIVIISHFDNDHVRFYPAFITRDKCEKGYNWKTV